MWVTMRPISSMWPASITRGTPPGLRMANELPLTSDSTLSAIRSASARQIRAGAISYPLGPGASSSASRKANERSVIIVGAYSAADFFVVCVIEVTDEDLRRIHLRGEPFEAGEGTQRLRLLLGELQGEQFSRHLDSPLGAQCGRHAF